MRLATLLILTFATSLSAQTVKLLAEVKVAPGRLAAVTVEWDGDDLKYTAPAELDVFREYDPNPKVVRLRMIGYAGGHGVVYSPCFVAGR